MYNDILEDNVSNIPYFFEQSNQNNCNFYLCEKHFLHQLILCPKMHHYHMWHLLNTILIGYICE